MFRNYAKFVENGARVPWMTKFFAQCSLALKVVGNTWLRVCCPCFVPTVISDYLEEALEGLGAEKPLTVQTEAATWTRYWQSETSQRTRVREDTLQFYECSLHAVGGSSQETRCLQRGRLVITYNYVSFVAEQPAGPSLVARWDGIENCFPVDWYGNAQNLAALEDATGGIFLRLQFHGRHYWTVGDFSDAAAVLVFINQMKRVRDSSWATAERPSLLQYLERLWSNSTCSFFP
eukprot:Gregarina_sp_Poly_1__2159@NODE_1572_length_3818_cov_127_782991_g1039_i0_p2_GENE_NODE_1572_length_3818_cov_127_782991_g1039_i0NODE_1572_length_3818_cov_127_782991_g1039_i0_p2_ORF_typecomplete_len234_score27_88_NODE_1572_length_3818_cov_127_782991_g1039_i026443345